LRGPKIISAIIRIMIISGIPIEPNIGKSLERLKFADAFDYRNRAPRGQAGSPSGGWNSLRP
jgi:hypothetical protein